MIDAFKQNIQERLIQELEKRTGQPVSSTSEAFKDGFMACFDAIEPEVRILLVGLDEIIDGEIFYAQIPAYAKEVRNKWSWGKTKHFENDQRRKNP